MAFSVSNGYGNSEKFTFTIPDGLTGVTIPPINLGRQYQYLIVRCTDVSNVANSGDVITFNVSVKDDDTLLKLERDNNILYLNMGYTLQSVIFVGCVKRVQCVLSTAASGGSVDIELIGVEAAVAR